jgi:hypothetical protein
LEGKKIATGVANFFHGVPQNSSHPHYIFQKCLLNGGDERESVC